MSCSDFKDFMPFSTRPPSLSLSFYCMYIIISWFILPKWNLFGERSFGVALKDTRLCADSVEPLLALDMHRISAKVELSYFHKRSVDPSIALSVVECNLLASFLLPPSCFSLISFSTIVNYINYSKLIFISFYYFFRLPK